MQTLSRLFICVLLCSMGNCAYARQQSDSIFVTPHDKGWVIPYKVRTGETVFSLSRRYHVPPALLSDANGNASYQALQPGVQVLIPIGAYNIIKEKNAGTQDARPLYYRVQDDDNLYRISHFSGVSQHTMQVWNLMPDNYVSPGLVLFVGWVLYDATQMAQAIANEPVAVPQQPAINNATNIKSRENNIAQQSAVSNQVNSTMPLVSHTAQDTVRDTAHITTGLEGIYNAQTNNGINLNTEKGPAVFYKASSMSPHVFYAFHNSTPRGTIIKVFNPGTGKSIFVEVLGPLPDTKQYYNSIIGISSAAKAALGVRENKMWCELSYGSIY